MYEPENLTPTEKAFVRPAGYGNDFRQTDCPSDAPTEREWKAYLEASTISAGEWRRYAGN